MRFEFKRLFWLVLFLAACTSTQAPASSLTPSVVPQPTATAWPRARLKSPEYGVQAFLWWKPEITKRDLTLAQELGFQWVKQSFSWRDIEPAQKGHYEWKLADPAWTENDEQYWWAISYPDWPENRLRPAFNALRDMPKLQR